MPNEDLTNAHPEEMGGISAASQAAIDREKEYADQAFVEQMRKAKEAAHPTADAAAARAVGTPDDRTSAELFEERYARPSMEREIRAASEQLQADRKKVDDAKRPPADYTPESSE
jgi:hypothetical protein